ncbi:MAG: hypothetical protein Q9N68_02320 [Gammaproteobacteria bacterium]|nr:hypothetical protein [Gammaproteobacteria bacterium]
MLRMIELLLLGLLLSSWVSATEVVAPIVVTVDGASEQSDIDKKIAQALQKQADLRREQNRSPFANKTYGIEFNVARFLVAEPGSVVLSGGFSLFQPAEKVELAFPIFLSSNEGSNSDLFNLATVDLHYRRFLGDSMKGFYLSGFTRLAYLDGIRSDNIDYAALGPNQLPPEFVRERGSEVKLGVGVGIGYRIFSSSNYYWGASLSMGRYLVGKNDQFASVLDPFDDDGQVIIDAEILKFGYAF